MAKCNLRIGRLVSHPCGARTKERCTQCGFLFCKAHYIDEGRPLCLQCAGRYTPPHAPISVTLDEMFSFSNADFDAFDQRAEATADVEVADS